jgi:hypothetical protein
MPDEPSNVTPIVEPVPATATTQPEDARLALRKLLMCNLDERSSEEDLKQLCFELGGCEYDNLPGTTKSDKARELIAFLETRNRIADLLNLGREKRPELQWDAPQLVAASLPASTPKPQATLATPLGSDPDIVGAGLQALARAMLDTDVQLAVVRFRGDFEFAQARIGRLGGLNKLQTLLQDLEGQQHLIEAEIITPDTADHVWAQAKPSIAAAIAISAQIAGEREQITLAGSTPLWVERLAASGEDMQTALAKLDLETLEAALDRLSRVIDLGSAFISSRLLATVDDLLRSGLEAQMTALCDLLVELKVEEAIVAEFNALLAALARLSTSLRALSADYQGWHGLLSELRFIEDALDSNFQNLDRAWVDISKTSRSLIAGSTEEWALEMIRIDGNLQAVLEEQSVTKACDLLEQYLELARKRRLMVVGRLLLAADELQRISAGLDGLLKTMNSAA